MRNPGSPITIHVIYEQDEYQLSTYPNEYRNLRDLIADRIFIEDFGECRGMGRCGTCLIEILEQAQEPSYLDRNETSTIEKIGVTNPGVRLACGILVDEALNDLKIRLLVE